MPKTLVTGGAGFIGSHLVDALLARGEEVVVFDDLSSGLRENLPSDPRLTLVEGTILDLGALRTAAEGCGMIYHLAEYIPNTEEFGPGHVVKFSFVHPLQDFEVSVRGTLHVLQVARELGAGVLFTSTAAVYGEPEKVPIAEDDPRLPASPYGTSKLVAEQYCRMFARLYDLDVFIVRVFNTYGPRQRKYVAYDAIRRLSESPDELEMLGSGDAARDFIYVGDTVRAILLVAERGERATPYNLGNGEPTTIEGLARAICRNLGVDAEVRFTGSSWEQDVKSFYADNARLRALGYSPEVSMDEGLRRLIDWFATTSSK